MKKAVSITLSFLILATMLHVSVVTHYCMGKEQESRISLSGRPVSCGMEDMGSDLPQTGTHLVSLFCDNVVTYVAVENTYVPASSQGNDSFHARLQVNNIPVVTPFYSLSLLKPLYKSSSTSPPGQVKSTDVELEYICIYRI